jgi:hypothetical protein
MGKIAGYAAIGAYIGAALLFVLGLLGLRHARKAGDEVILDEPRESRAVTA